MNQKLTTREFIFSQILILTLGLIFLGTLYFVLYLDYPNDSNVFSKTAPVTKEPTTLMLELNMPDDDLLVFNKDIEISGRAAPNSYILVTGKSDDLVLKSTSDGSFSADFELSEGINEVKIIAFDQNGEQKILERAVYFSKEKI